MLISEAVETVGTYICLSVVFGPSSSHESRQVFYERVMASVFVRQKKQVDGMFTVTVGTYVQRNQFSSNFMGCWNERRTLCGTKWSVCYTEIENQFRTPV